MEVEGSTTKSPVNPVQWELHAGQCLTCLGHGYFPMRLEQGLDVGVTR